MLVLTLSLWLAVQAAPAPAKKCYSMPNGNIVCVEGRTVTMYGPKKRKSSPKKRTRKCKTTKPPAMTDNRKESTFEVPLPLSSRRSAAVVLLVCGCAGSEDKSRWARVEAACFEHVAQARLYATSLYLELHG